MAVVGVATTNSQEAIAPFSDAQIVNYEGLDYEKINQIVVGVGKKQ